jgi:hypothetical protein
MVRRLLLVALAVTALCAASAAGASAATVNLVMSEGAAFSVLGHSCGGIQEKVYETGFAANGYPQGNVHMETRCGGSGRGGGGGSTTYTATATVIWTWLGETWKWGPMVGSLEAIPAEDSHGDRLYNVESRAYLEAGTPPYQPPAPPANVKVSQFMTELGENEYPALSISWEKDPERFSLITKQTMRAEPVGGSTAPVVEAERIPYFSEGSLYYLEPNTLYKVTVTESDNEGTSAPSAPVEVKTLGEDGEHEHEGTPGKPACTSDSGSVTLSPGLTAKPKKQKVTIAGTLSVCEGGPEGATYTVHLKTAGPVSCALLTGAATLTASAALSLAWLPAEEGSSTGTISFPLGEGTLTGLSGAVSGGPFSTETAFATAFTEESFAGGSTCGVREGKKAAKPVKSGSFTTPIVEFG